MLRNLPQKSAQNAVLKPNTSNPQKAVEYIDSYIDSSQCENMSIDISFMNVIDACYVSTTCSTHHYLKYPNGKINWQISFPLTKELISSFELGNTDYSIV